jgi:polyhydroxyalkanoate synthesis repressor PhaR
MNKRSARPLIIKKYENRRLYNTLTSQYLNQNQVAELVRDGYEVRVVDAATGEDLTRLILAQIVLDDAKTPDSAFPVEVLRQMIVASGKATQEGTMQYLKTMMDMYQNVYRTLPAMNPFEFMQSRLAEPVAVSSPSPTSSETAKRRSVKPPGPTVARTKAVEVEELKQRIEELELLMSKRASKKTVRSKSRRKS